VEVRLLGPVEVEVGGLAVALPRAKQRAFLAVLALEAGQTVPVGQLVDALWGDDPPAHALGSLHNLVSQLRRALGPNAVVTRAQGYALACPPDDVDVHRFERLVSDAREGGAEERARLLREALALWRGPPLADVSRQPFATVEAARLAEERTAAREALLDAELERGKGPQLVAELERLVAEHPLRERFRAQLMLALYRSGRQAEALEAYGAARATLVEELGLDPSPELAALHAAVLRQDPALSPAAPAAAGDAPAPEERRKTVTALFVDLVDSTALATSLDPEVLRIVVDRYFDATRAAVERHGGVVEKYIGDAVAAVFGVPVQREDDALRAIRAAVDVHAALADMATELARSHGISLRARAGVATGTVLVGVRRPDESRTVGGAMTVAARLQSVAGAGETLIAPDSLRLVGGQVETEAAGEAPLGRTTTVKAFRLRRLVSDADLPPGVAPFVGREAELETLLDAFARARNARSGVAVTVIGEAGAGKSRLVRELATRVGPDARVLVGRCASYGEGATWLPLLEALRPLLAGAEGDAAGLEALRRVAGHDARLPPVGETFSEVRRLLEVAAQRRPAVLVLDDLHWAEPTLLDLVDYLRARPPAGAVLLACLARTELLERRPDWRDGVCIRLTELSEPQATALLDGVAGAAIGSARRREILDVAAGNPLFLEQLAAHVVERGDASEPGVPPTIEAVLGSRLETLERAERRLLECAAVVGREFRRGVLLSLLDDGGGEGKGDGDTALIALLRRGLVRIAADAVADDAYRFHHALVRDVAYAAVPLRRRAALHERAAGYLDGDADVPSEVVGLHLETAVALLLKLGDSPHALEDLRRRAAERLGDAGIRAWKGADASTASNLLGRAAALLPDDDAGGIELRCELGTALRVAGRLTEAESTLARAVEDARAAGVRRLELRAELELGSVRLLTSSGRGVETQIALARAAICEFERAGDDRGLGRACMLEGYAAGAFRLQNATWLRSSERAAIHYFRAGWPTAWAAAGIANALFHGPTPAVQAIGRCRSLRRDQDIGRHGAAHVTFVLGGLEAMRGRFDTGRTLVAEATFAFEELGLTARRSDAVACRAWVEMLAGDLPVAEAALRDSTENARAAGDIASALSLGTGLADLCYRLGRLDEADALARDAQERGSADDMALQFSWRMVRAKLLAADGAVDAAVEVAAEAVRLAGRTDALNQHGQTEATLAEVLLAAGRRREAEEAARRAAVLFRRKGNRVLEQRVREAVAVRPLGASGRRRGVPEQTEGPWPGLPSSGG
jgi:DNA-binding SARP family transcriptional activator